MPWGHRQKIKIATGKWAFLEPLQLSEIQNSDFGLMVSTGIKGFAPQLKGWPGS